MKMLAKIFSERVSKDIKAENKATNPTTNSALSECQIEKMNKLLKEERDKSSQHISRYI